MQYVFSMPFPFHNIILLGFIHFIVCDYDSPGYVWYSVARTCLYTYCVILSHFYGHVCFQNSCYQQTNATFYTYDILYHVFIPESVMTEHLILENSALQEGSRQVSKAIAPI